MSVLSSAIQIKAPAERVFDLLTSPKDVIRFIPGGLRVTKVPPLPLGRGSSVHWEFILLGVPLRGSWVIEEIQRPFFYIARTIGGVEGRLTYTLLPKGKSCRLTVDFEYQAPESVVKRFALGLIEPHAQSIFDTYLESLKNFVEAEPVKLAGSARSPARR